MYQQELGFRDIWSLATQGIKARLTEMVFQSRAEWNWPSFISSKINYQRKVEPTGNSIIMAAIGWAQRTFPEAPIIVESIGKGTDPDEPQIGHPLTELLAAPNPFYSGNLLWNATITDYFFGNAYWIVLSNAGGRPVQIWWAPRHTMAPKWNTDDPTVFISHYEYTVNNVVWRIPAENVVHFRQGMDPKNTRLGLSMMGALFQELFTDSEGANWTAQLLANGAVPGLVISPQSDKVTIDPDKAEIMKKLAQQKFSGDKRGEAMVLSHAATVQQVAWNPEQMNMRGLRRIPEERATAVIGIPAIVCGLGAGLDRSTYSNMGEAREHAYEGFMIPTKTNIAADLQVQLLPKFADPKKYRVAWDYSKVRVLQEDEDKKHARARENWKAGISMLDEAREMIGLPKLPKSQGQIFAVPMNLTMTPADELYVEPEPVPAALVGAQPQAALPPGPDGNGSPPPASSTGDNPPEKQPPPGKSSQDAPRNGNGSGGHSRSPLTDDKWEPQYVSAK